MKIVTPMEAVDLISNGDTIAIEGFVGFGHPEELTIALEKKFISTGHPQDLTIVYAAGQGDGKEKGMNRLAKKGLVKRVIGGHWGLAPKLGELVIENEIEGYNFPQGVLSHLFRDIAGGRIGTISRIGLHTFVDPRLQGGKLNNISKQDLIKLIKIDGNDYLLYKSFPINIGLLRGTTADENGNVSMEKEALFLEVLQVAQAVKNSGGKVIVQVERIAECGTLNPKEVKIPGILVDAVVVASEENHMQSYGSKYNYSFSGEVRTPKEFVPIMPLNIRKIISRRALLELKPKVIINVGIGFPEGVALVASEENINEELILTVESGPIKGIPAGGLDFGAAYNPDCIIDQPSMFDFYDGGGLDIAFLGMAQVDAKGNVNVSKYESKIVGAGGFINITQSAKKIVYCGTMTTKGLEVEIMNGYMKITSEGNINKFVDEVEQITFNGAFALENKQEVVYVTERAVFKLCPEGLMLIEIAPGIDLKQDILRIMGFKPVISPTLTLMDTFLFTPEKFWKSYT
jgi:propionate CoA-transferase